MPNIVLIGMPTCGKSTVGVLLAKHLGFRFVDTDLLLQEKHGKFLHQLIEEHGIQGFIALENDLCRTLQADSSVIATGGSAVYGKEGMQHLKEIGTVVYLKISFEMLKERLGDYKTRGVILPDGYTLKDLFEERSALYESYADVTVDETTVAGGLSETLRHTLALCQNLLK